MAIDPELRPLIDSVLTIDERVLSTRQFVVKRARVTVASDGAYRGATPRSLFVGQGPAPESIHHALAAETLEEREATPAQRRVLLHPDVEEWLGAGPGGTPEVTVAEVALVRIRLGTVDVWVRRDTGKLLDRVPRVTRWSPVAAAIVLGPYLAWRIVFAIMAWNESPGGDAVLTALWPLMLLVPLATSWFLIARRSREQARTLVTTPQPT